MASVLHGSARTTPRIRAELQASQESSRTLAARYGLNPKTVSKWRKRITTGDEPMGPKAPKSTVLTSAEEAIIVEFRRRRLKGEFRPAFRKNALPLPALFRIRFTKNHPPSSLTSRSRISSEGSFRLHGFGISNPPPTVRDR